MNIALIIYLFLSTLSLGFSLAQHGEERTPTNGWNALIAFVVANLLVLKIANII